MSFTEEKFIALSKDNKIRKTVFAIQQYLSDRESEIFAIRLLEWLCRHENMSFKQPKNRYEWGILSQELLQILKEENPFLEKQPFDDPHKERKVLPIKVLLDNIRSPFNAGSILRSAEALGLEEVLLCGITPHPQKNPKVEKTAKESPIAYTIFENSIDAIKKLKDQNYKIYALEKTTNSLPIHTVSLDFPMVLIVGNEEFGIAQEILRECDAILYIPLLGAKNSLNVSVAAGIAFYEITKRFLGKDSFANRENLEKID